MFSNEPTLAGRAWEQGYNNISVNNQQRQERLIRPRLITEPTETDHRQRRIASREVSLQYFNECDLANRVPHICIYVAACP